MLRDVVATILRPEWKKFILPILVTLIIFSGIASIHQIRSQGLDSKIAETSQNRMLELSQIQFEEKYLGENYTEEEKDKRLQKFNISEKHRAEFNKYTQIIDISYRLTPVAPSSQDLNRDKISFFRYRDRYVIFRDQTEAYLKILYSQEKLSDLNEEISENRTSWSKERLDSEFEEIKSTEIEQMKEANLNGVQASIENSYSDIYSIEAGNTEFLAYPEKDVKEVKWYHFTPAVLVSFTMYYILNSVLVEGIRAIRNRRNNGVAI
jgi:hypothetical protein